MAKQPKIRFKGFSEEWKEKKISDLLLERIDMAPQNDAYPLMAFVANKGIVSKGDRYDRSALIKDAVNKPYKRTSYGDFIYSSNNLEAGSIGMNFYGNASISPVYSIFAPKGDNNPYYLGVRLAMPDVIHEMVRCRQGVVYGQWKIHEDEFLNISVKMPKPDEQKAISQVIIDLTTTISQREKELEKLKNIKRALLERMFPQDGQTTPSIRFNGFTDEWEEKKADDIFISFDERNHPELPVLAATQDKGMVIREEIGYKIAHNTSNEVGYKHVLPGQFVIHLRSFQGGFAHSNVEGITSPAYDVFGLRNPEKHDDCFWKYIFCSSWFIKRLVTVTYGIRDGRNVSYNEFLGLSFMVPSKQEQIRIAKLFKTLGEQISLRERQLTLLKHTKQALLEQMFVNE